jgi:hypothetical protein
LPVKEHHALTSRLKGMLWDLDAVTAKFAQNKFGES